LTIVSPSAILLEQNEKIDVAISNFAGVYSGGSDNDAVKMHAAPSHFCVWAERKGICRALPIIRAGLRAASPVKVSLGRLF
jgi:hypothetical protein